MKRVRQELTARVGDGARGQTLLAARSAKKLWSEDARLPRERLSN